VKQSEEGATEAGFCEEKAAASRRTPKTWAASAFNEGRPLDGS